MEEFLWDLTNLVNDFHDFIVLFVRNHGYSFTDKELHIIVIAIAGILVFGVTHLIFKFLAKYSVAAISFIYTFTVLVVVTFAIELEQKITNRGSMDFEDVAYGLYGFITACVAYLLWRGFKLCVKEIIKKINKYKNTRKTN